MKVIYHDSSYNYSNYGHYSSSCALFKITFQKMRSIAIFKWNLLEPSTCLRASPEDGERIQSSKRRVLNKRQADG
jgi:hypothetical protein